MVALLTCFLHVLYMCIYIHVYMYIYRHIPVLVYLLWSLHTMYMYIKFLFLASGLCTYVFHEHVKCKEMAQLVYNTKQPS